jgi:ribonuclease P protein component
MLPKIYRLTRDQDFKRIYKNAPKLRSHFLSLRFLPNQRETSRFGFIISNTISPKATQRNKYRRQLRTIILKNLKKIKSGFDVILKLERVPQEKLNLEMKFLLQKGNLFK